MKIYQFLEQLMSKFVPLDQQSQSDLHLESVTFYQKIADERQSILNKNEITKRYNEDAKDEVGFEPKPLLKLSFSHKIIGFLEQWFMRYFFALLFIYLVPKIKAYINGEPKSSSDDFDEDDDDDDEYREFLRFKNSRR